MGGVEYVPCFSHILHRVVVEALCAVPEMNSVVSKITKMGLHFAKSTAGAGAFARWQCSKGHRER